MNMQQERVPATKITMGDVVKIHNWYGVVLETYDDEQGNLAIIRVQTARNLYRGYGPEYLDVRLMPEALQAGTLADLQEEMALHQRLLDGAAARLLAAVTEAETVPLAAD
jgi:hypothetical protein